MYADFKCYQQSYAVFVLAVICVCVSVCVYLSIYLSIYIYIYISISLSIYICMCVCVCIYIHKKRNLLDAQIENCHPSRPQHFVLIGCSPPPLLAYFSSRGLVDMAGAYHFSEYTCLRSGYMLPAPVVGL